MAKDEDMDLHIERPELNLVDTPRTDLPDEVPDVLDGVVPKDDSAEKQRVEALFKDIEIYLQIGDLENARATYLKLFELSKSFGTEFHDRLRTLQKTLDGKRSFMQKLGGKGKVPSVDKPQKSPKKSKEKKNSKDNHLDKKSDSQKDSKDKKTAKNAQSDKKSQKLNKKQ